MPLDIEEKEPVVVYQLFFLNTDRQELVVARCHFSHDRKGRPSWRKKQLVAQGGEVDIIPPRQLLLVFTARPRALLWEELQSKTLP